MATNRRRSGLNAKYQVFISSTYNDLRDERAEVIRAVLEMGHIPVGMEMFSAADEEQWKIIARHIDESDYYILVVANRYGSKTDGGISYTQKEYEYALSVGVPVLGFLLESSASWPADRTDRGTDDVSALERFKDQVRRKPVSTWTTAADLYGKCSISLMKAFTTNPRPGWVRATGDFSPQIAAEIARLSEENAKLRADRSERKASQADDLAIVEILRSFDPGGVDLSYRKTHHAKWEVLGENLPYVDIFNVIAPEMVIEASVRHLAMYLALSFRQAGTQSDIVPLNQVRSLLVEFMTEGMLTPSTRKHSVSDQEEYWTLTEFGVKAMTFLQKLPATVAKMSPTPEVKESSKRGEKVGEQRSQDGTGSVKTASAKKAPAKKVPTKKPAAKKTPARRV